ncbi:MAG: DNA-directed RNA polymerase subunit P [Candidatus Hydrothermarchaeales archaeon]
MYTCAQCSKDVEFTPGSPVRCPYCGFKIIFKTRPKVVKKVRPQ